MPFPVRLHSTSVSLFPSQHGADVQLHNNDGRTALMCASQFGHSDIVALLLQVASPAHPFPSPERPGPDGGSASRRFPKLRTHYSSRVRCQGFPKEHRLEETRSQRGPNLKDCKLLGPRRSSEGQCVKCLRSLNSRLIGIPRSFLTRFTSFSWHPKPRKTTKNNENGLVPKRQKTRKTTKNTNHFLRDFHHIFFLPNGRSGPGGPRRRNVEPIL